MSEILCPFIGEEYDAAMKTYATERVKKREGNISRWKNELDDDQVKKIHQNGGHLLERYGYI